MPPVIVNKSGHASPDAALHALLAQLAPVQAESVDLPAAAGRVLAAPVLADRDSPPCDLSVMDGYAVRLSDLDDGAVAVEGEVSIGRPIATLPAAGAMRIFTGCPIPRGAQAVIPREDTDPSPRRFALRVPRESIAPGQNIRWRGQNIAAGQVLAEPGTLITPALTGALAAFGVVRPTVYRRVRVGILTTGNELLDAADRAEPWQIRDSNGPALSALLAGLPWVEPSACQRVGDDRGSIATAITRILCSCDAVLLTGGVSMGDYDWVPDAIQVGGGRLIFHRLPIRPGKPVLAAVTSAGQPILALPGNPVSVLVTGRRLALPALAHLAGFSSAPRADAIVRLANPDDQALQLHWFRLVRWMEPRVAELLPNQGSGDLAGAARADGFVEVPPGATGKGPFAFYRWTLS